MPDLAYRQPPAGQFRPVPRRGDAAEEVGDEIGDRLVRAFRDVEADALEHVDPAAAVDVPGGAALLGRGDGEFGQVVPVVLVAHLADEFLDDVLQGHDPGRTAVLVDDDGDGLLAAQPGQERLHGQRLRDEQRRLGDAADRGVQPVVGRDREGVLEVGHADDLVDPLPVDGEAREAGGPGQVDHVLGGGRRLQGADLHARRHHVLRGQLAQGERADEEVGRVLFQGSRPGPSAGRGDQFTGGAGGGQLVGGLDAEGADQAVGDRVESGDDRAEEAGEDVLGARDEAGDLHRLRHRPVLGHQLADHHLHGGGQQHADDHGDTGHGAFGYADGGEGAVEYLRERRFGEHADDEGGDGDAELGAGELERQLLERAHHLEGPAVTLGRGLLGLRPLDGDEAELGGHEEAVGEDQQERGSEEQQGDGHAAASRCREGAAQVLQDDPSIAGRSHSSISREPPPSGGGTAEAEARRKRLREQINQDMGRCGRGDGPESDLILSGSVPDAKPHRPRHGAGSALTRLGLGDRPGLHQRPKDPGVLDGALPGDARLDAERGQAGAVGEVEEDPGVAGPQVHLHDLRPAQTAPAG